jgi:hypothetical protein
MTARYAQRDMHIMHIDISIIPPSSRGGMRDHFGPKRNNSTTVRGTSTNLELAAEEVECSKCLFPNKSSACA